MNKELDSTLARWGRRWLAAWVLVAAFGMSIFFIDAQAPWYRRLLAVLFFQVLIGAWFVLLRYVQVRAADSSPAGDSFRGPMPAWRAMLWVCVAAVGVFWFGTNHSWLMAVFASLFCALFIGGFAFVLNWVRDERGKAWSRKHIHLVLTAYGIAFSASILLKLLDIVFRKP
jgi:hypothetical protein